MKLLSLFVITFGFLLAASRGSWPSLSSLSIDLDWDGREEKLLIYSSSYLSLDPRTYLFINYNPIPRLSLKGHYLESNIHEIKPGEFILEVQTVSGKSVNSLVYFYRQGSLRRIPVSTENSPYYEGVVSRNEPEFRDTDGDGIQEMLVYYRHFPPDFKRTVEIYKLNGETFKKIKEYEESTPEVYL
ncbi:MAG: hypothetical protein UX99_C0008G0016 [Candidatus Amesbacteria bacterium GW2011_GWB1_47_26]|uniref:Uncharacterized protein n=1 Tax=Candidatus Amesbacteria bacterium GW2011_GWC2_45_19 TaxID=1618366 RepID=A0A0G1M4J4_9BACT|nr:MAG: hypothetical protein UX05_C0004G0036 [Candidatus Amesbacteria bacterium GW2011_GWC2_45_19]KKU38514.1 MAG: hypothetical protein UX52_C0005G0026 [Candidatus Amesbacteria bacterium GW2011_GWA1_46_35]KKU69197.1 MAG: hypothetical protein UX93_C0002G0036 [Microgenomates group bacterium GW2011_GWC1_47_20]KKU74682.1 MAG: hypothetical protein UX99_C0008G0016 [Candidatus Amesbacteria bacterium GW2011_GWB1_47_26]KKU80130.1 MAG: hypothetical protein UY06_C0005G0015 [Candidatus Amesbacteria bacteriu